MAVRAKFAVTSAKTYSYGGVEVELSPQYDPSIPEDIAFQKATPQGGLKMLIEDNPKAIEQLKPGKVFYLDLTEVPPAPQ